MIVLIKKLVTLFGAFGAAQVSRNLAKIRPQTSRITFFSLLLLSLFLSLSLKGCAIFSEPQLQPLRIGLNNWPGYAIMFYAQEKGIFAKRGLSVELVRFSNQQDNVRAMLRGALDASFVPFWEVMQADPGENKPVYLLVADVSHGSDGIVAQSAIKSVKELKGKRVGTKLGTVSHLILLEALNANQLQPLDVEIDDVLNETAVEKLQAGSLDAAVLWEPTLQNTAKAIQGNVIFTTKEVDSTVVDGLATSASFVTDHKAALTKFILAWFDTIHALETEPEAVFEIVGQKIGQTGESFAEDYAGLRPGDLEMNQRMFGSDGRLSAVKETIMRLLQADPRHSNVIRQDVEINGELVLKAIEEWQL